MGQDSTFLVNAIASAKSISVTDVLIYHYRSNVNSAMNTFNPRKIYDAIVWRYRAWYILENTGYQNNGRHLLFNYWSSSLLESIESMGKSKSAYILEYFVSCLKEANYNSYGKKNNSNIHKIIDKLLHSASQIKITVSTQDARWSSYRKFTEDKSVTAIGA